MGGGEGGGVGEAGSKGIGKIYILVHGSTSWILIRSRIVQEIRYRVSLLPAELVLHPLDLLRILHALQPAPVILVKLLYFLTVLSLLSRPLPLDHLLVLSERCFHFILPYHLREAGSLLLMLVHALEGQGRRVPLGGLGLVEVVVVAASGEVSAANYFYEVAIRLRPSHCTILEALHSASVVLLPGSAIKPQLIIFLTLPWRRSHPRLR